MLDVVEKHGGLHLGGDGHNYLVMTLSTTHMRSQGHRHVRPKPTADWFRVWYVTQIPLLTALRGSATVLILEP